MGLLRRIRNSLLMEWHRRQKKPCHKTTTEFFSAMNAEHQGEAMRRLEARPPSLQTAS
jgi:hypothetical protein